MATQRRDILDLDERTARLGRDWFAEARKASEDEAKRTKRARDGADTSGDGDGGGLFSWLFGDGDADSDGCDGGGD